MFNLSLYYVGFKNYFPEIIDEINKRNIANIFEKYSQRQKFYYFEKKYRNYYDYELDNKIEFVTESYYADSNHMITSSGLYTDRNNELSQVSFYHGLVHNTLDFAMSNNYQIQPQKTYALYGVRLEKEEWFNCLTSEEKAMAAWQF